MKKIARLYFLTVALCLFAYANAQTTNEFGLDIGNAVPQDISQGLILDITPPNPGPNEEVTVLLKSNATDLSRAQITWRINNTIILEQIGATKLVFNLGQLNESQALSVTVAKYGGGEITATHFFTPTEVDLIYEANTYTPPFYRGRALATHQSEVRVVAIPRILDDYNNLIPAEEYSYTWKKNGKVIQDQSGYGKNIFTYINGLLEDEAIISVEAVPRNYNAFARGKISITPKDPMVVVYEKNPIYGTIFEQAVSGVFSLNRDEITLRAIPYFFSGGNIKNTWGMNGEIIDGLQRPDEVILRIEGEDVGISDISVNVSNETNVLQSAGTAVKLFFEKQ